MRKANTLILYFFVILILLFSNEVYACQVDFQYENFGSSGVVSFIASSTNANSPQFTWSFGDGESGTQPQANHTYSYSGDYVVCLYLNSSDDCTDLICHTINVVNENSLDCQLYDCVYPGDSNQDGFANIYDLFSIGMHNGDIGPARNNANNSWDAQPSQDWALNCIGGNLKHSDCNGDGLINRFDLIPIATNYQNNHDYITTPSNNSNAPLISLEFSSDSFIINQNNPQLLSAYIDIVLGTAANPIDNLYALAFSLNFSDDLIDPNSISIEYNPETFFCDTENVLFISKTTSDGMIDVGFSRTDQTPVSGHGRIARVNFTIIGDIIITRSPDNSELPLSVETHGTRGINDSGNNLSFNTHGDIITFKIDSGTAIKENGTEHNLFSVSPNPSTGLIKIDCGSNKMNQYEVFDTAGKLLRSKQVNQSQELIDLSDLPYGTYFIKVTSGTKSAIERIVISQ